MFSPYSLKLLCCLSLNRKRYCCGKILKQMSSVQLYRYDISGGMARNLGQAFLGRHVEAIWHTGIVVFGKEYYFDGGVGIVSERAGTTRFGRPLRVDSLGVTQKGAAEFETWVGRMRSSTFGPNDYNLLQRNCNHFTQEASMFLLGIGIGEDIRNMIHDLLSTPMGAMIRPMLEQMTHSGPQYTPSVPQQSQPPTPPALPTASLSSSRTSLNAAEVETLQLALAMLESSIESDPQRRAFLVSMQTLISVVQQIITEPHMAKYRRVKTTSSTFQEKILGDQPEVYSEPVHDILSVAGFISTGDHGERYYALLDANGSVRVLEEVRDSLRQAVASQSSTPDTPAAREVAGTALAPPPPLASTAPHRPAAPQATSDGPVLTWRRVTSAASDDYTPIPMGKEGGEDLFSIRYQNEHLGKAVLRLHPNGEYSLGSAHVLVCAPNTAHREVGLPQGSHVVRDVEVLCAPRSLSTTWLPLWLVSDHLSNPSAVLTTRDGGAFALKSSHGDSVHPASHIAAHDRSLIGAAIVIPYGGRGVNVTNKAEVLCVLSALPVTLQEQWATLQRDHVIRQRKRQRVCAPIRSIDDLLTWAPPAEDEPHRSSSQWPWTTRSKSQLRGGGQVSPPRLLVCHDFKGGYHQDDQATFTSSSLSSSSPLTTNGWNAYVFQAWEHTDIFVYFSHARISIPPLDWITAGHRHGVPVLGTFITEWETGRAEWMSILTNPQRMGAVIGKLVDVAEHYGFNGYLLNVENEVAAQYVQRLTAFVKFLRKQLKERLGEDKGVVVWYDAVTTEGRLSFQNALNHNNKTFFDAADAIFLNYFWKPASLDVSAQHCGARKEDVYVGIDCFGRSTFGGGGYDCHIAMQEIVQRGQSAAMFAPGWTLENASGGTWEGFLTADAKFWGRIAPRYLTNVPAIRKCDAILGVLDAQRGVGVKGGSTTPLLLASFSRGAGTSFHLGGERLIGCDGWVQRAGTSPSSLPSGQRHCSFSDTTQQRGEVWRLPIVDDVTCVPSTTAFHNAQLLSTPSPYMGDLFLALDRSSTTNEEEGRWVQLYRFADFPINNAAQQGKQLLVDIVWRHRGGGNDDSIAMIGVTVASALPPSTSMMLSSLLSADEATPLPGGWLRTKCSWELSEAVKVVYLESLQVTVPASTSSLDIGCLAIGTQALDFSNTMLEAVGGVSVVPCDDLTYVSGDAQNAGGLQLTFLKTKDALLHPVHLVATLAATANTTSPPQRLYLGEHLVPISQVNSANDAVELNLTPTPVIIDVDIVLPEGTSMSMGRVDSISAHCVPLHGWLLEEQVIWTSRRSL